MNSARSEISSLKWLKWLRAINIWKTGFAANIVLLEITYITKRNLEIQTFLVILGDVFLTPNVINEKYTIFSFQYFVWYSAFFFVCLCFCHIRYSEPEQVRVF